LFCVIRYGFFYLGSKLDIVDRHQYLDTQDYFERPPFSVFVRPKTSSTLTATAAATRTMLLTANHIQPSAAPFELDKMVTVYESLLTNATFSAEFKSAIANRWLFMGDFNAGCSYVTASAWNNIRLRNQTVSYRGNTVPTFTFLISDQTATTTAAASSCPYDRFVVTPALVPDYNTNDASYATDNVQYVKGSAKIFNFTAANDLDFATTRAVSDHYPIELEIANFFSSPVVPAQSSKRLSAAMSTNFMHSHQIIVLIVASLVSTLVALIIV